MTKKVEVDVNVDDNGTTKKVALDSKNLGDQLDKTSTSAHSADRRLKGAAQASSNTSKNFSKMAQGISGGLVPAYATLAANIFAISAAFNFFKRAADVSVLIQAQESYATSTGVGLQSISSSLREASGGMLTFRDAAQAAAIGVAKGFSPKQLEDLAVGARKASAALGRDFEDAFDRLIRGTSKAEPELLDELGITLRLERATTEYARAINKNVKELTAYERSQAVLIETQRQINEQFGDVEAAINPFQRLAVTFNDIVKGVTQFILPAFNAFAEIINRSALAAIAIFGTLAISIAKAAIPVGDLKEKFADFQQEQAEAVEDAKRRVEEYTDLLKKNKQELEAFGEDAAKGVQSSAQALTKNEAGGKSKLLQKAARGEELTGLDKATLKRAIEGAEKQFREHGEVRTGIFAKADMSMVRSFDRGLTAMDRSAKAKTSKIGLHFQKMTALINLGHAKMAEFGGRQFARLGRAAEGAGKIIDKAFRFAGVIGIAIMLYETFISLRNNIFDISLSIVNAGIKVFNTIRSAIATVATKIVNALSGLAENIPGLGKYKEQFDAAKASIADFGEERKLLTAKDFEGTFIGGLAKGFQDTGRAATASKAALAEYNDTLKTFIKENEAASKGLKKANEDNNAARASTIRLNRASTAGFERQLDQLDAITDDADRAEAFENFKKAILDNKELLPQAAAAVLEFGSSLETLRQPLVDSGVAAGGAIAAQNALRESLNSNSNVINSGNSDLNALREAYRQINAAAKQATESTAAAGESFDGLGKAAERLGEDTIAAAAAIDVLIAKREAILDETSQQNITQTNLAKYTPLVEAALNRQLALERLLTQEKQIQLDIENLRRALAIQSGPNADPTGEDPQTIQEKIDAKNRTLRETQAKVNEAQKQIRDVDRIGRAVADSFESGMVSAFEGVITGTKTMKDAFKDMATSILRMIARMIAELIAMRIVMAAMSLIPTSPSAGIDASMQGTLQSQGIPDPGQLARYGGVMKDPRGYRAGGIATDYSMGGIARGRDAGYPAVLHGTEAVVPLPNNRSIPVDLRGDRGTQNNVTVNVTMTEGGGDNRNTSGDGQQGVNLGNAIAMAVQKELQNQKRSGGILNPYGAA